jgi:alkane 1-monooxygenase
MGKQWLGAAGYTAIFLMPALLLGGVLAGKPWLAFGVVAVAFPVMRLILGALPPESPEWSEAVATFLDKLPLAYPLVFVVTVLMSLGSMSQSGSEAVDWIGYGLSLWMTCLFATCVAHELFHRRDRTEAVLGHVLAGLCGYPVLGTEHLAHHARPGNEDMAEAPRLDEGLWRFAGRRLLRLAREFLGPRAGVWSRAHTTTSVSRMRRAMVASAGMALAFVLIAGWQGAVLVVLLAGGVAFGVQIITYIQHWGLGAESLGGAVSYGRGWEEDCRFQAWITLNISLHDVHHREARLPYYRLALSPDSPRLPAGYVVLMFVSLVPPLWFALMRPSLQRWRESPMLPVSAGRRLTCFGL